MSSLHSLYGLFSSKKNCFVPSLPRRGLIGYLSFNIQKSMIKTSMADRPKKENLVYGTQVYQKQIVLFFSENDLLNQFFTNFCKFIFCSRIITLESSCL